MENSRIKNRIKLTRRARRVRQKLKGTAERPRLCLVKSNAHLQAQLIDDESGKTLGAVSTFCKEFRAVAKGRKNKESAAQLGKRLGEIAKEKQIDAVIFDRGASKYHGVVAAFADGAREAGLKF